MFLVRGQTDHSPCIPVKITTARAEREVGPSTLDEYHRPTWVILDTGATHTTIPFVWLTASVSREYIGRFFIGYELVNEIRQALDVADEVARYRYRLEHKEISDAEFKTAQDELVRQEREITDRCRDIDEIGTQRTGGGLIGGVKLKEIKITVCPEEGPPEHITAPAVITRKGDSILLGISTVGQLYMCWLKDGRFYLSREQYHAPLELCQCQFTVTSDETSKLDSFKAKFRIRPYSYYRLEPISGGFRCSAIVEGDMKDSFKDRVEGFCRVLNLSLLEWEETPLTRSLGALRQLIR